MKERRGNNFMAYIVSLLKEFIQESANKSPYEILNLYECPKSGMTKAEIKLCGRHIIEKNISEIVTDMNFLEGFDKKTIRTLTYMATIEKLKPDYSIVVQQMDGEVEEFILEIKSRNDKQTMKKSPTEMSKDKSLISKFSPIEANQIGWMAGVNETVKEYKIKSANR